MTAQTKAFLAVLTDPALIAIGQEAIGAKMTERRNRRESRPLSACGLVICEDDGRESDVIRMSVREALLIALVAIGNHLADSHTQVTMRDTESLARLGSGPCRAVNDPRPNDDNAQPTPRRAISGGSSCLTGLLSGCPTSTRPAGLLSIA